ncbi:MAG TPA: acyl-CoA synthetase [Thermoanaerobaculia bacterium]|jgi:malonyl-CoA/methylmalonyl-CoA synthetase|nr:acyl-CoA synthetase [Thermoanaerobaculia bacterium]
MNLHDLFAIPVRRSPGKPALRFVAENGTAEDLSYAQLFAEADRLAAGFQVRGVRKGDRIAFFLSNRPEFVTAYLAVIRLGAVMVPVNLAYRRREIAHMLADAGPRLLLTERAHLPVLAELADDEKRNLQSVLLAEHLESWTEEAAGFVPPLVEEGDLAMLLYTSGTTGRSKGALITHGNVMATMTGLLTAWAWEPADSLLLTLPLFHTHGLVVGLHCALAAGATVLLRRRFAAAAAAQELLQGAASLFFGVPTMYVRLVEELRKVDDRAPLARMRLFCSGSAPLAPETFEAFRDLTGHAILERYGMTETGMNLSNPYVGERVPGSVGTPLPGVSARIIDAQGLEVTQGNEGELLVLGSNVFAGYWQAPEKTAESFVHDDLGRRWFRTGDLARQDPATGAFTLLGRRTELIISGGFNIYPREIEELLASYSGVQEAAVVGRPHPEWGEVPVAFLVIESTLDNDALITWCKTQLAAFKVPRTIHVVDALPRNALGKVQKHLLPH